MAFVTPLIKEDYEMFASPPRSPAPLSPPPRGFFSLAPGGTQTSPPPRSPTSPDYRRQSLVIFKTFNFSEITGYTLPRSRSAPNMKVRPAEDSKMTHRSILRSNTLPTERHRDDLSKKAVKFAMFAEQYTFDKRKPVLSPKTSNADLNCSEENSPKTKRGLGPKLSNSSFFRKVTGKENKENNMTIKQALVANTLSSAVNPVRSLTDGVV